MTYDFIFFMRFLGEFSSTTILLCLSCLSCTNKESSTLQTGLASGLTVMIIVHCFGFVSGAHANPCITLSCWMLNYISAQVACAYVVAQILGALFGYALITVILPESMVFGAKPGLGITMPDSKLTVEQAFGIEFVLTSILLYGWCALWDFRCCQYLDSISLRIGLLVAACCLAGGHLTGASMNPARTLAPAVFQENYENIWIYFGSQLAAAIFVPIAWKCLYTPRYTILLTSREPEEIIS